MTMHRFSPRLRLLPVLIALGVGSLSMAVQAQSLVDLYTAARSYDAAYQSAKLQFDASQAKADQAQALMLPTVGLSAGVNQTNQDTQSPASNNYTYGAQSATIAVSQPLYRPSNLASFEQGKKSAELAQVQLSIAEQDLIVRVSQAYFDVLAASDTLEFVKAQKSAVGEQFASAKRNFEVGTSTVTDSREAQARYDLVIAQELAAENDLLVKRLALSTVVGLAQAQPKPLLTPVVLSPVQPADPNLWVDQSQANHPSVVLATLALDIAKLETNKAQAGHKPTLDLTGSYTTASTSNGSASSPLFSTSGNQATVGLALNLPLFTGFATQNRIKETVALEEKARTDLEAARRGVAQATRTAYFGLQSGLAQVNALQAAQASSQSALDANKLGYQVGVRINIDVLNAESQLFDTKAKLAKARYDVLVGGLKLRQANGTLKADDLQAINSLLAQ